MKPVKLQITKKTFVPTKYNLVHQFRQDWIIIHYLDYSQTQLLFKILNGYSGMTRDSHFAYWMYQNFGEGEYSVNAWQKGRKGFWNFIRFVLSKDGFMRVKKKEKKEDKELLDIAADLRRKEKRLKKSNDLLEKEELSQEIQDIKEDKDLVKEMNELDEPAKSGCYPFLKSCMPLYKIHEYEDWNNESLSVINPQAGHMQAW